MLNNPKGGLGYAAEFQSSALPWVTSSVAAISSTIRYDFPKVTRFISLLNHGTAGQYIRVGFTKNGVENGNFYRVDGLHDVTLELRVRTIYVRSDVAGSPAFDLCAGLTNIDSNMMPVLSGTLPDGSAGWLGVG